MEEFEITLEGTFGWDITLEKVQMMLREAAGAPLVVKVSSNGGDVEIAGAIKNTLEEYMQKNNVGITFDMIGWAQSAASYVTMINGAKRIVHPNTLWMHHNPQSGAHGDHRDLMQRAEILARLTTAYSEAYSAVSGKSEIVIAAEMEKETYLVGQEIVDAGFADEMIQSLGIAAAACSKDTVILIGKKNFQKVSHTLQVAAMGEAQEIPKPKPQGADDKGIVMTIEKKEENGALVADETKRAMSLAAAMTAMPEKSEALAKAFEDGKSADYFDGQTAFATEMKNKAEADAEAEKLKLAGGESPDPIVGEDGGKGEPITMKASGLTGKMMKV